jgi:hypothetical protein
MSPNIEGAIAKLAAIIRGIDDVGGKIDDVDARSRNTLAVAPAGG